MKVAVYGAIAALVWMSWLNAAAAHTSYLKPNLFSTADADAVTLESAFTESFLNPDVAVESQDFHLYLPDGARAAYDRITVLRQMTVLEAKLATPGTYRFTTGERLGRTGLQERLHGDDWRTLEPGAHPTAGAETRQIQTATVADVYVTKGAPTKTTIGVSASRLAIQPITHPSEIYVHQGFRIRVLFDGAPLANQELHLYRDGASYDATPFDRVVRTDTTGAALLTFVQAGVFLVTTRTSAAAPAGAQTRVRSYTTSLTFEVTR